jgi:hypothetical protein
VVLLVRQTPTSARIKLQRFLLVLTVQTEKLLTVAVDKLLGGTYKLLRVQIWFTVLSVVTIHQLAPTQL